MMTKYHLNTLSKWFWMICFVIILNPLIFAQKSPVLSFQQQESSGIFGLTFSSDGKQMFTGAYIVQVWDFQTGQKIRSFTTRSGANAIAISPDGKFIVTGGSPSLAELYNAETGEYIRTFDWIDKHISENPRISDPRSVFALAFTSDGKYVIGVDGWGQCMEFEVDTGKGKLIIGTGYKKIIIFPDGDRIFSEGFPGGGGIFSRLTGKVILTVFGPSATLSSDYKYVYDIRGDDSTFLPYIETWDVETGQLINKSTDFNIPFDDKYVISPDGKLLFKPEDKVLRVFSTETTEEVGKLSANVSEPYRNIQFVPNSKKVLGISGNTVQVWDISDLTSGIPGAQEQK